MVIFDCPFRDRFLYLVTDIIYRTILKGYEGFTRSYKRKRKWGLNIPTHFSHLLHQSAEADITRLISTRILSVLGLEDNVQKPKQAHHNEPNKNNIEIDCIHTYLLLLYYIFIYGYFHNI